MSSSPQLSTSVNAEKLVNDLKECIDELSSDFTNSALPIDDDSQICQRLCVKLEQFLLLGLNEKSSLFGRKKFSYWDFFKASLTLTKGGVDSALRFANYNPEVRTSVGKGRAFLRYCLVHGCLADAIQQSLMTAQILATWYSESAPMRNDVLAQELVSATYALCDVNFDLAPGGHDLDGEWPTCRRHFGSPSRSWKPLSRSTSFASLASSSFSLDPGSPPPVGSMGAMGSLPEGSQQEIRSTASTLETSRSEDDSNARQFLPTDQVKQFMEEHREEVKSLIEKYETEIKQLSDNNFQLQQEVSQLRLEKDCVVSDSDSSGQEIENLKSQVLELKNLNDQLVFYEGECQKLQSKLQENEKATRATIKSHNEAAANQDTEMHELKMKLLETQSENNTLKTHLSSMEVECSKMTTQLQEFEEIKASLESTESRSRKYREQLEETGDLRKKLAEVREDYERVVEKLRTEETRWAAEMEQKVQQAKWEMGSLQKCVDNLLKENGQLRDDLTKATTEKDEVAERLVAEISAKEAKEVELTQLREDFAAQNETIAQLKKDLKRLNKSLEDEVAGRDDLKDTLAVTSKECVDLIQQVQELSESENNLRAEFLAKENTVGKQAVEIDQLKMDLKNLQEHVVNLVSQKEKLFKECYNLKQAHRERVWQHDSQVQHCSSCRVQFSLLVRKHHCRHCGQIFCGACSSHWLPVNKGSSRRTRSCSECHSKCQETSDTTESGECASTNPDNPTASDVRQDSDDDDEDFSVISEDDVNLSQCVPYTPNPEILQYWQSCEVQSGMTKRVAEMLGHNSSSEVWVRAGVIYSVPILVNAEDLTPQVNITWQFSTEPNCIAFSILYKPDADVPPENSSILVPTTRVNSHLHPIRGKLKARKEGLYTLLFDNSYSRFTGKKLQYSLVCEVGAGSGRSSADPESPARAVSRSPSKDFKPIADST